MTRPLKFRIWDGEKMRYLDQMFVGVNQIGFSNEHYVDLAMYDKEDSDIMQFTGLLDKNGKEIYEGDIVKNGNTNMTIIWDDTEAKYSAEFIVGDGHNWTDLNIETTSTYMEIIGNIYENPELIK